MSILAENKKTDGKRGRVAIIGGGIAGSGAAWALTQDHFECSIFESSSVVGGNAKTFVWPDGQRTGLSVLAWPHEYFNNYEALLKRLKIKHTEVNLNFYIRSASGEEYVQGDDVRSSTLWQKHQSSLRGWSYMLSFVRIINRVFNCFPVRKSLYRMNMLNPLNLVPLRWLSIPFGVRRECWDDIIVPMYASTFLSTHLDYVPAIILPIISDIIPLEKSTLLRSWEENSTLVFDGMLKNVQVHLNEPVTHVKQDMNTGLWTINQKFDGFEVSLTWRPDSQKTQTLY